MQSIICHASVIRSFQGSKLRLTGHQYDQKLSAPWQLNFQNWLPAVDSLCFLSDRIKKLFHNSKKAAVSFPHKQKQQKDWSFWSSFSQQMAKKTTMTVILVLTVLPVFPVFHRVWWSAELLSYERFHKHNKFMPGFHAKFNRETVLNVIPALNSRERSNMSKLACRNDVYSFKCKNSGWDQSVFCFVFLHYVLHIGKLKELT